MLITIHNLPSETRYSDIKSLIHTKCGMKDIILDNLLPEGVGKKVTVGVADEGDAAMLVRNLNGFYIQDLQLYVEVMRQRKPEDQPYHNALSKINISQNNQNQSGASSDDRSQRYQNPTVPQFVSTQIPPPHMVPPPMGNYNTASTPMGMGYRSTQVIRVGFGTQGTEQHYASSNMVSPLVSYPAIQNMDYELGMQNTAQNNRIWESNNANSFNASGHSNFDSYSNSPQSRFDQAMVSDTNSQVDTRMRSTINNEHARKRNRNGSPAPLQSYSYNMGQQSRTQIQGYNSSFDSQGQSWSSGYNKVQPNKSPPVSRQEASIRVKRKRWDEPQPQKLNYGQMSKFSRDAGGRSTFDGAKRYYNRENFNQPEIDSSPPKRFFGDQSASKTNNSNNFLVNVMVPRCKMLLTDKNIRGRAAKAITKWILNNVETDCNVSTEMLAGALRCAVKARVIFLTNYLYNITTDHCIKQYRLKFPEIDDKYFFNVVVKRYKRDMLKQTGKEPSKYQNVHASKSELTDAAANSQSAAIIQTSAPKIKGKNMKVQLTGPSMLPKHPQESPSIKANVNASKRQLRSSAAKFQPEANKQSAANVQQSALRVNEKKIQKQVPAPGMLPKHPQGIKQVYKDHKKQAKLEFQEGPSAIRGDPFIKGAVEKEISDMDKKVLQVLDAAYGKLTDSDQIFIELFKESNAVLKINEAFQLHILRRLMNTGVQPVIRIVGNPKPPNKAALTEFLKSYAVLNLRKSDRNPLYIATCETYETYDKLCDMGSVDIGGISVSFKPMHLGGPPIKKWKKKDKSNNLKEEFNDAGIESAQAFEEMEPLDESFTDNNEISTNQFDSKEAEDIQNENDFKAEDTKYEKQTLTGMDQNDPCREGDKAESIDDTEIRDDTQSKHIIVDNNTAKGVGEGGIDEFKVEDNETALKDIDNNKNNEDSAGDYEVDNAENINIDEVDEDDLEDY